MIRNVLAGIVLLAASSAFAQPTLSPQVQADLLLEKITTSMEAGRAQEALDGLVEYRKLGVKMPPAVLFLEARLAAIAKDYRSRPGWWCRFVGSGADRARAHQIAL